MKKWGYYLLVVLLSTELLCMVFYKTGISPSSPPTQLAQVANTLLTYIALPSFCLVLLHFALARSWFFFTANLVLFAVVFWIGFERALLWQSYRPDFSLLNLLYKIEFWASILVAVAGIYTDRGRLSWLAIYGVVTALHTSIAYMFVPDPESKFHLLMIISSMLSKVIMIFYFWSVIQSMKPRSAR